MKTQFFWTKQQKKVAHRILLDASNHYEVKRRKRLNNVKYYDDGRARWEGLAHDYTVDLGNNALFQ